MPVTTKQFKVDEKKKSAIEDLFPKIALIRDDNLREQVIEVWVEIWNQSKLQRLQEITINRDEVFTFLKHINVTADLSLIMAEVLMKEYRMTINVDYVLAIAFLHDVDQIILREKVAGKIQSKPLERLVPHGMYGGHIALEKGLPPEIFNGIVFHRPSMPLPATIEALIVRHCDHANYDAYSLAIGINLKPA